MQGHLRATQSTLPTWLHPQPQLSHAADGFCFGHHGSVQCSLATHSFKLWISASDVAGIVQGERNGCCCLWSLPHLTGLILTARGVRPGLDLGPNPHASVPISFLSRCPLHRIKHTGSSYTCFDKHTRVGIHSEIKTGPFQNIPISQPCSILGSLPSEVTALRTSVAIA